MPVCKKIENIHRFLKEILTLLDSTLLSQALNLSKAKARRDQINFLVSGPARKAFLKK